MARPKKQTIDYFPHSCTHGKTMFIIEQKYGNDGYAFWFKLLEFLGNTTGHYIDLNDETTQEFLQAKTRLSWDLCYEILELLAKLKAIDAELWEHKIVWSQNFVNGISEVYKNRRVEMPSRPSFYIQKPHGNDVSTSENTQSKVNKSKVNKSKVNNICTREEKSHSGKVQFAENVSMTNAEHEKLVSTYGQANTTRMIEKLNNYKGATGKKYKSDYRAILNWVADEIMKTQNKDNQKQKSWGTSKQYEKYKLLYQA